MNVYFNSPHESTFGSKQKNESTVRTLRLNKTNKLLYRMEVKSEVLISLSFCKAKMEGHYQHPIASSCFTLSP